MKSSSFKRRRFLREARHELRTIVTLAMINLFTFIMSGNTFPWFLFPAFFISISIVRKFVAIYLDEDEEDQEVMREVDPARHEVQSHPIEQVVSPLGPASTAMQAHLSKVRAYKEQINRLVKASPNPNSRTRLEELSTQIGEWVQVVTEMAQRVDSFQQNTLIHQDLESVPQAIEKLEAQLGHETNETIRAELEQTLANRKSQLAMLERLRNTMRQAEIKIESTLASLGTIYSQLLMSQSTDHVADYSRLSAEVNEEVRTLQDHLEALEEVKLRRVQGN